MDGELKMEEEREEKQGDFADAVARILARITSDKIRLMYAYVATLLLMIIVFLRDYPVLMIFLSVVLVLVAVSIDLAVRRRRQRE